MPELQQRDRGHVSIKHRMVIRVTPRCRCGRFVRWDQQLPTDTGIPTLCDRCLDAVLAPELDVLDGFVTEGVPPEPVTAGK